jgi:hypothetical protein
MPAGLTLEQLKAKGAKPAAAPAQGLTLQQLQAAGAKPAAAPTAPAPQPGFVSRVKADFQERNKEVRSSVQAMERGEQTKAGTGFDIIGQELGLGGDVVMEALKSAFPHLPKPLQSVIKGAGAVVGAGVEKAADKLSETKFIKEAAGVNTSTAEVPGRPQTQPAVGSELPIERHIKAGQGYLNVLPGPKGVSTIGQAIKKIPEATIRAGEKVTAKTTGGATDVLPTLAKEFAEEGIEAPVSAITKSKFLQGAEAVAAKSPFGRKIIDVVEKAGETIEQKTNAIIERIKPAKSLSDENLGKTIQEGLKEYEQYFKVGEEKVYADFAKRFGSRAEALPYNTRQVLTSIVEQQGKDFFKGIDSRFSSMLDRVTGETKEIKQMRAEGLPEDLIKKQIEQPILTFDELKSTRTSVGEQLARDTDNGALKRLYGALSADMERAVNAIEPSGKAAEYLQYINAQYKSGKAKIESRISQSIEQSNPERIAQNLITRNSADTLRTLREMIGTGRFEEISRTFLRQQLETSMTRGKFDLAKLKTNLAKYDDATLKEALNVDVRANLDMAITQLEKLQRLTDALKKGQKYAEGSQTAFLTNITTTAGAIPTAVGALFMGNPLAAAVVLLPVTGQYALAQLFGTQTGRAIITGTGAASQAAVKSVGDYLKTAQPGLSIKATNPLDAFDAEDVAKATQAAEQISGGTLLSQKDWTHLQELMKSYGYTLPENQKKAAEFILTSVRSGENKAFDAALDAKAQVRPTAGGFRVQPPKPKPKAAPSKKLSDYLRDSVGRFSTH